MSFSLMIQTMKRRRKTKYNHHNPERIEWSVKKLIMIEAFMSRKFSKSSSLFDAGYRLLFLWLDSTFRFHFNYATHPMNGKDEEEKKNSCRLFNA